MTENHNIISLAIAAGKINATQFKWASELHKTDPQILRSYLQCTAPGSAAGSFEDRAAQAAEISRFAKTEALSFADAHIAIGGLLRDHERCV